MGAAVGAAPLGGRMRRTFAGGGEVPEPQVDGSSRHLVRQVADQQHLGRPGLPCAAKERVCLARPSPFAAAGEALCMGAAPPRMGAARCGGVRTLWAGARRRGEAHPMDTMHC